ncbi:undecaprenyldiphospho-muramoylpentapeptide beta-N-acetylglucosaminyltransferase [Arenicella sp. 4NH20-0111]|uniref:undecaprenyldiphospho-muramoylpentapeptide beta-N-acetylglucosaminyltransferase n=1 Tax=Arenicella sp. 4NH20-0111 TaxID=3127648 RepID=UPI0031058F32
MSLNGKHILVMAGGTGGHVFPALAVAKMLAAQGAKITWLGTRRGLEATVVPENGFDIEFISVEGLRGKGGAELVLAPFKLVRALWQSASVMRSIQPDCVIGFGGFVSGPGGLMSYVFRTPLIIHEQNSVAGLTNKWLAKLAKIVLTGFPDVLDLPKNARWVGNPVRSEISSREEGKRKRLRVLVIGGSQGAHSFNMKLPKVFSDLGLELKIKHQAGRGKSKQVRALYDLHEIDAKVVEFIDDMAAAYQWSDLLVCRAGAMTIAECCAVGKPALLIPFPFSAGDHQIHNAMAMVDVGAGEMVLNHKLDSSEMVDTLVRLTSGRERLQSMGECARTLYKPNATEATTLAIKEVLDA